MKYLLKFLIPHILWILPFGLCLTEFDRDRISIRLDLYDEKEGQDQIKYLGNVLELVGRKFSKIHIYLDEREVDKLTSKVPKAVALYNRKRTHFCQTLKLQILYKNGKNTKARGFSMFNYTFGLAAEANSIFPETATELYLDFYDGETCADLEDQLGFPVEKFASIRDAKYQLGLLVTNDVVPLLATCMNKSSATLPFVDKLLVFGYLKAQEMDSFNSELNHFLDEFLYLKNTMYNIWSSPMSQNVQILFQIFPYNSAINKATDQELLLYFQTLNRWAVDTNSSLVILNAFDQPNGTRKMGWWRLSTNRPYSETFEDYDEKEAVLEAKRLYDRKQTERHTSIESPGVLTIVSVVTTALFVLLLATVACLIVTKRLVLKQKGNILSDTGAQKPCNGLCKNHFTKNEPANLIEYDKSFEMKSEQFKIENSPVFSFGFGTTKSLHLATIMRNGEMQKCQAFVITEQSSKIDVFAIVCNLKLLSFAHEHPNILKLFGAYTAELNRGVAYIFTETTFEFTLDAYLKLLRWQVVKAASSGNPDCSKDCCQIEDIHTRLYNWIRETADVMSFLATKSVVLGNLCTKTLLLGLCGQVKIADISFVYYARKSRQGKRHQLALVPWRTSAPETITRLVFNEKTDVWSFGVLTWEILSLGNSLFSGIDDSKQLLNALQEGYRFQRPTTCDNNFMYAMMLTCLELHPSTRPTFNGITQNLQNLCRLSTTNELQLN